MVLLYCAIAPCPDAFLPPAISLLFHQDFPVYKPGLRLRAGKELPRATDYLGRP